MKIEKTKIDGLLIITPEVFGDDRGFFVETFNKKRYEEAGIVDQFVQDNLSGSQKGVLRGLHFQREPFAQGKLIQVVRGRVLDVAVDIRKDSETFGQHVSVELSGENKKQFWIPAGFAHGFVALEDDTIFSYKCTNAYNPESEGSILWNDEKLGIDWKLEENGIDAPIVSEKDQKAMRLEEI
ncbi:MAG: dTDP-4-dehydrorhamnose 3,5-epimerase [Candidatus Moranbacteria bacterium]|nr:dTDP-4-dehydrorhamnose 3,5-epimerase [Candidatus Moranbacteria bacterium]